MSAYPADLPGLTRLRFFAALWVVFYHWRAPWSVDIDAYTGLFAMGRFGVDLFFILSGFILTHVYLRARQHGQFNFLKFIIARFARIYPLHIGTIAAMAAMGLGAFVLGVPFDRQVFALTDLPANLLMIHAWGFAPDPSWNGPSWSISAEWFAYLAFPAYLMIALALSQRPIALLGIAVASFFVLDWLHRTLFGESLPMATEQFGVIRIIPEFLIGVGLYQFGARHSVPGPIAMTALIVTLGIYLSAAHFRLDDRIIALLGAPIIYLLAELDRLAPQPGTHGPFHFLGEISYAVYMIHVPFFMFAFNLLQDVLGLVDTTISTGALILLLALMLAVSGAAYKWFERPVRESIRRWGNKLAESH